MQALEDRRSELLDNIRDATADMVVLRSRADRVQDLSEDEWTDEDLTEAEEIVELMVVAVRVIEEGSKEVARLEFLLSGGAPILADGAL